MIRFDDEEICGFLDCLPSVGRSFPLVSYATIAISVNQSSWGAFERAGRNMANTVGSTRVQVNTTIEIELGSGENRSSVKVGYLC